MPWLFSYGTLQQPDVQLATFGRPLEGAEDALPGFEPSLVKIENPSVAEALGRTHHANVIFNGRRESLVSGTVYDVTEAELAAADEFERPFGYRRIAVTLESGKGAWVYVEERHGAPLRLTFA